MTTATTAPPHAESAPGGGAEDLHEIEDGVIEEARGRQRERRRGVLAVAGGGVLAALMLAVALGGGGGSSGAADGRGSSDAPMKLAFRDGRPYVDGQPFLIAVSPSLEAGAVKLCVAARGIGGAGISQTCGEPYAGPGQPAFDNGGYSSEAQVGPRGEVDFTVTGPNVAAVRVKWLGTFATRPLPDLPPGDRAAVFYRPPGSLGTVLPPGVRPRELSRTWTPGTPGHPGRLVLPRALTETPLDRAGRPIAIHPRGYGFQLPNSFWQRPARAPVDGRCGLASRLPGASVQWGMVATGIAPDRATFGSAFLTCLQAWYTTNSTAFQAAVLLNAKAPGRAPAPLWGAVAVPGHPGIVQVKAVEYRRPPFEWRRWDRQLAEVRRRHGAARARRAAREVAQLAATWKWAVLSPATVARRVGDAWLLVRYGGDLGQQVSLLDSLRLTHIDLVDPSRRHR
jgi:hypothetical protein